MTPSLCEAVLNTMTAEEIRAALANLRMLWLNGEVVTVKLFERLIKTLPKLRVFNLYSISETHEIGSIELTAANTWSKEFSPKYCPVGKPTPFSRCIILNEDHQQVAPGETGELYVVGPALARGYDKPELTAERFVPCPFATSADGTPERMYQTGDMARFLPDGNLEILGRCNYFVKVGLSGWQCCSLSFVLSEIMDNPTNS